MALNVFSTTQNIRMILLSDSSHRVYFDDKSVSEFTPTIGDGSRDVDFVRVLDRAQYVLIPESCSILLEDST